MTARPLRERLPQTLLECAEDFRDAIADLEEMIHLPGLPQGAERLAAQAALRMTGAATAILIIEGFQAQEGQA